MEEAGYYLVALKSVSDRDWLEFVVPLDPHGRLDGLRLADSLTGTNDEMAPTGRAPGLFRGTWEGRPELGEVMTIEEDAEELVCVLRWAVDGSMSITDLFTTKNLSVGRRFWFWENPDLNSHKYEFVVTSVRKLP